MSGQEREIGNYRIVRELGRGAFGQVYLAQHLYLDRHFVAIKLLYPANFDSQQEIESFLQEARILAQIQHRYILPFIDFGIYNGSPYLVTAYAPNGSLKDRLRRASPYLLPLQVSLNILSQIGEALHYAHQQHIVHRDLKPGNILFSAEGDAMLADFGLAITLETASIKYISNEGTPRYMAPEQFKGRVSKESDQYALGIIAYELFTGQVPFRDANFFTLGIKHVEEAPVPPSHLNPHIPLPIEQAILKALAKERTARHASVVDFIKALWAFPIYDRQAAIDPRKTLYFPPQVAPEALPRTPIPPFKQEVVSTGPIDQEDTATPSTQSTALADTKSSTFPSPTGPDRSGKDTIPIYSTIEAISPPPTQAHETSLTRSDAWTLAVQGDPSTGGSTPLPTRPDVPSTPPFAVPKASTDTDAPIGNATAAPSSFIGRREHASRALRGPRAQRLKRAAFLVSPLIFLILLLVLGGTLYLESVSHSSTNSSATRSTRLQSPIAATAALVTITPDNTRFKQSYLFTEVTGKPDAARNQVGGTRIITSNTHQPKNC